MLFLIRITTKLTYQNQDQRHKYHHLMTTLHLTLKMTSAQVVTNNSLEDYLHLDDHAKQIKALKCYKIWTVGAHMFHDGQQIVSNWFPSSFVSLLGKRGICRSVSCSSKGPWSWHGQDQCEWRGHSFGSSSGHLRHTHHRAPGPWTEAYRGPICHWFSMYRRGAGDCTCCWKYEVIFHSNSGAGNS